MIKRTARDCRALRHLSLWLGLGFMLPAPGLAQDGDTAEAADASSADADLDDASSGASSSALNDANNPLANMMGVNLHNYYAPRLNEVPDASANTLWLRAITPYKRLIPRLSIPVQMRSDPAGGTVTGLGDLNVFAAVVVTPDDSSAVFGLGPIYVAPTATSDSLGSGTHQLGLTGILVWTRGPLLLGALTDWQTSVTDRDSPDAVNMLVFQYLMMLQVGQGYYIRSAPIWTFGLEDSDYVIPFGLGVGKVVVMGNTVFNAFLEPQFTIAADGVGMPTFQLFAGLNVQFLTGDARR